MSTQPTAVTPSSIGARPRTAPALVVAGMLVVLAMVAAACGSSSSGSGAAANGGGTSAGASTPIDGGSMVIGIGAETNGWNPALGQWADTGSLVGSTVIEPLATEGEDRGAKPWLAESWIANETFTDWQVKLKPNITFQNGEPFDAAAVKKNIDFYLTQGLSSIALKPMFKGVTVVDPLTLLISVNQPWASFPSSYLQSGGANMMAPAMIDSPDHGAAHPIGTGPFIFESWTPDSTFKAKKNPNYWQPGLPHLDSIEFRVIPDDTARADALKSGDVNMILTTSATVANAMADKFTVLKDWSSEAAMIMTNTAPVVAGKPNPLSNIHARLALAYATDPEPIARSVGEGVEIPSSPWSPPSPWSMPKDQNGWISPNLDKAKAEVDAYKADTGATNLSITLSGLPNVDDQRVLQLVDSQWKDAGIEISIESLEQTAYITKIALGDYQAAFFRNYGYPDPDMDLVFFSKATAQGAGNVSINFTQFANDDLEAALTAGRSSGYVDQRKAAYDSLVKQLNASATNIWLYNTPYSFISDKSVHGMDQAEKIPFGTFMPKTWISQMWRQP